MFYDPTLFYDTAQLNYDGHFAITAPYLGKLTLMHLAASDSIADSATLLDLTLGFSVYCDLWGSTDSLAATPKQQGKRTLGMTYRNNLRQTHNAR